MNAGLQVFLAPALKKQEICGKGDQCAITLFYVQPWNQLLTMGKRVESYGIVTVNV